MFDDDVDDDSDDDNASENSSSDGEYNPFEWIFSLFIVLCS